MNHQTVTEHRKRYRAFAAQSDDRKRRREAFQTALESLSKGEGGGGDEGEGEDEVGGGKDAVGGAPNTLCALEKAVAAASVESLLAGAPPVLLEYGRAYRASMHQLQRLARGRQAEPARRTSSCAGLSELEAEYDRLLSAAHSAPSDLHDLIGRYEALCAALETAALEATPPAREPEREPEGAKGAEGEGASTAQLLAAAMAEFSTACAREDGGDGGDGGAGSVDATGERALRLLRRSGTARTCTL